MGQRKYGRPRCEGCGLHQERCLCPSRPQVTLATRIVVVQHIRERFKPTNTGKLVPQTLTNSTLLTYALRDEPFPSEILRPAGHRAFVLFPREDAMEIEQVSLEEASSPVSFVVLDGTWHQCSRMARRVPGIEGLPLVRLPAGPPSQWVARTQHDPRGVSTFEAVIRLLACVEGPVAVQPLEEFFCRLAAEVRVLKGLA